MTEGSEPGFDAMLLDLHLGQLSAGEQTEALRRIAESPALAEEHAALGQVMAALRMNCGPTPAGLGERVAARIRQQPSLKVLRREVEAEGAGPRRVLWLSSMRDLSAVAALLVLAIGLGAPGVLHMRERSQRMGCSANLAQLGVGMQAYASTFGSSLPFAGSGRSTSWQPSADPDVVSVPNRRHMYPLLAQLFVRDARLFICPSQKHVPMPQSEIGKRQDFLESRNVSYAYQNMAGVRPSTRDDPRLALLADENPLFADGAPLYVRLSGDPAGQNTRAHHGAGQNVLTLRGEVIWATTPLVGVDGDNVWTLQNVTEYTGREGPKTATDSHLLK